jgi:hypothetical protein
LGYKYTSFQLKTSTPVQQKNFSYKKCKAIFNLSACETTLLLGATGG